MTLLIVVPQAPPCQRNHMWRTQVGFAASPVAKPCFLLLLFWTSIHRLSPPTILHPRRADLRRDIRAAGKQNCRRLLHTYWVAPLARRHLSAARGLPLRRLAHLAVLGRHRGSLLHRRVRHDTHTSSSCLMRPWPCDSRACVCNMMLMLVWVTHFVFGFFCFVWVFAATALMSEIWPCTWGRRPSTTRTQTGSRRWLWTSWYSIQSMMVKIITMT